MIQKIEADKLCTQPEFELYLLSLPRRIARVEPKRLKNKIDRARKLRIKYREKANQQKREAHGKSSPRSARASQNNQRTRRKQQLFGEVLKRLEERQAYLNEREKRKTKATNNNKKRAAKKTGALRKTAANKTPRRKKTAKVKKATAKVRASMGGTDGDAKAKRSRLLRSGKLRKQRHTTARGRRRQAKRDTHRRD